jgi:hypothetical protein
LSRAAVDDWRHGAPVCTVFWVNGVHHATVTEDKAGIRSPSTIAPQAIPLQRGPAGV